MATLDELRNSPGSLFYEPSESFARDGNSMVAILLRKNLHQPGPTYARSTTPDVDPMEMDEADVLADVHVVPDTIAPRIQPDRTAGDVAIDAVLWTLATSVELADRISDRWRGFRGRRAASTLVDITTEVEGVSNYAVLTKTTSQS